jgi:acyl-CoA synthetase (AMP-forming)/AMP-acid ligase II
MHKPIDWQTTWGTSPANDRSPSTADEVASSKRGVGDELAESRRLVDALRWHVERGENVTAFRFLNSDGETAESWTRGETDAKARMIASALEQRGLRGERAVLVFDPGLDFVAAFLGCLYAGVTAVPLYPPDPFRLERTLARLQHVLRDASGAICLTTSQWSESLAPLKSFRGEPIPVLKTDLMRANGRDWSGEVAADRDLAFLQYTSGSTGDPKGVMVSHGNLRRHLNQIHRLVDRDGAIIVSWLPVYHDMGLIAGVLQPWYSGRVSVLMSPLNFFQKPIRWLKAIEAHHATTTVAPDFAYDVCVRKTRPEERAQLDLSRWVIAMNGSEPIRTKTMDRFTQAFAVSGFRREAFLPCYGLAEATLMVTGAPPGRGAIVRNFETNRCQRSRVGSGALLPGWSLAIVDPAGLKRLPPGEEGEIWVRGGGAALGYWKQPALSEATFQAYTADGDGPYLRTGDLGVLDRGELFVTGRLKEIVIIHGRNHSPHEMELTIENSHPALKPHAGAVFAVDDGESERVIAVQEVMRPRRVDLEQVTSAIAASVLQEHHLVLDEIVLIEAGTLPKTTSGKIQRLFARDLYQSGRLRIVKHWFSNSSQLPSDKPRNYVPPQTDTQKWLAELWQEFLGVQRVGIHDHFLDLGGHSLLAAQMLQRMEFLCDEPLTMRELFEAPTIAQLAELIDQRTQGTASKLAAMLDKIEGLDDGDVIRALEQA